MNEHTHYESCSVRTNVQSAIPETMQSSAESQTDPIVVTDSHVQAIDTHNKSSQTRKPSTHSKANQTMPIIDKSIQTNPILQVNASTRVELEYPHNNKYTCTDSPIHKHVQTYVPKVKDKCVAASHTRSTTTQTEKKSRSTKASTIPDVSPSKIKVNTPSTTNPEHLGTFHGISIETMSKVLDEVLAKHS
ncbi:MAG: hypothetical protein GY697_17605 [Desulfobacterales bacterium]|nr:hypothetical protein [Desulfobacterales bacterium]